MNALLFDAACLAVLVAVFVRGSDTGMFLPTPWTQKGFLTRQLLDATRRAFVPRLYIQMSYADPMLESHQRNPPEPVLRLPTS